MRRLILPLFFVMSVTSCGRANQMPSGLQSEPASGQVTITGAEANAFIDALTASGVRDTDRLIGAYNLRANSIDCSAPVVPNPPATCTVVTPAATLQAPAAAGKAFFRVLMDHGGRIFTGVLGTDAVAADGIVCSRPVVPDPQGTCSFYVGIRNG